MIQILNIMNSKKKWLKFSKFIKWKSVFWNRFTLFQWIWIVFSTLMSHFWTHPLGIFISILVFDLNYVIKLKNFWSTLFKSSPKLMSSTLRQILFKKFRTNLSAYTKTIKQSFIKYFFKKWPFRDSNFLKFLKYSN